MNQMLHIAQDVVQTQKANVTVAAGTIGATFSAYFEWLPANITWISGVAGFTLSCVMVYTSIRKDIREQRRLEHEIKS